MEWAWLLLAVLLLAGTRETESKEVIAQVNPRRLIQYVPERFLSITLDPANILLAGNLGTVAKNMARGLSPSFVRLGGKSTNYMKFGKELMMDNTTITESQWDSVYKFATDAGLDLITSINPTERINGVWDSRDALQLISYSHVKGYNVAWQLGYDTEGITASGSEVGRDIVRLRKILDGFKRFAHTPIFGPDLKVSHKGDDETFVRDLLFQAGPVLGAIFMQPDWKRGEDPMITLMNAIIDLDTNIWGKSLRFGRIIPRKPLWIADGAVSSGRSEEAIELVKRVGSAARLGVQVVMRQLAPLTLNNPTPEFWTALLYKNLVGRGVLDARVSSGNGSEIMLYSHCTQGFSQEKSIIDSGKAYDKGAVTVFGVNELTENVKLSLKVGMREETVHLYSLTFADSPDGTIEETKLNGQLLTLSPTGELPIVSPRVFNRQSRSGITIPPRSVFFFVLPNVKSRMCSSMPLIHTEEAKELSKKLIEVAANVLDKPNSQVKQEEEEYDKNKIYVKFGKRSNSVVQSKEENLNGTVLDKNNGVDTLSGTKTEVTVGKEETSTTEENTTTPMGETTSLPIAPTTVSPPQEKTRRKRSPTVAQPVLDLELADQNGLNNQEELVNEFNSFADKVYKSSQAQKNTGDIQIQNIPESLFNTLKKVKVIFKYLGTTSYPEKLIEKVTEAPTFKSDPAGDKAKIIEKKEEEKEEDTKLENLTESERKDESSEESKEDADTKDNTFRAPLTDAASKSNAIKGEKVLQELDVGSEIEPSLEPAGSARDERKERIPRNDPLRQSESSLQPSSSPENDGEATGNEDTGPEVETVDESSKDERDPRQSKSYESLPTISDSVSNTGSSHPSKLTSQDNKDAPKEKKKLKLHRPLKSSHHKPGKENEISDPVPKSILTTTEMPDFIKIDGYEQDKVDELLLKIAKTNVKDSALLKRDKNKSSALNVEGVKEKKNEELKEKENDELKEKENEELKEKENDELKEKENDELKEKENEELKEKENNELKEKENDELKEKENEELKEKENDELKEKENDELKEKENEELKEKENDELKEKENDELKENENEELKDKNKELTDKNEELTDKNEELTDKNEELTDKNEELKDNNEELNDKNDELKDKNEELKDKADTANSDDKAVESNSALTESNDKVESEKVKAAEEASQEAEEDLDNLEEMSAEEENEKVLDKGPLIKEASGPKTIKVPREIPTHIAKTYESVSHKLVKEPNDKGELIKDQSKVSNEDKNVKSGMIELLDEKELSEEDPNELPKTSAAQIKKEKLKNPTEAVKDIKSFKDVPLNESEDKSYTPPESKASIKEKESIEEADVKASPDDEAEVVPLRLSAGTPPKQASQEASKEEPLESEEETPQFQQAVNLVPLIVPMSNPFPMMQAPTVPTLASIKSEPEDDVEATTDDKKADVKSEKLKVKDMVKELSKKTQSKAGIDQERKLKLLAIRNQIMEARERFKAAAREEGWRAALEQREQQMKDLLQQRKEKQKFFSVPINEHTIHSRPRRLTYDPASNEMSKEDIYDYGQEQLETYGLPDGSACGKTCIPEQALPLDFNNPDPNHIIFPLDPKAQQAVVYNNRIIPARLYGVIPLNYEASKLAQHNKQAQNLALASQYQKYFKSYDVKEPHVSDASSSKHLEPYTVPRDLATKSIESQQKYIPIVVIPQKTGLKRRKRSLPSFEKPIIKANTKSLRKVHPKVEKASLQKRSLDNTITTYTDLSGYTNPNILDSHIISNEIIPLDRRQNFPLPGEVVTYEFPMEMQDIGEPRTIGGLPPLPLPLPVLPPLPPPVFPPPPAAVKGLPETEHPLFPTSDTPLFGPELKRRPDPPQVYLFSMLQDKFKSLVGLVESLADWCGAYK